MPVSKLPTQKSLYGFLLLCCKLCYANFIWRRKWIHNNRVMLRIRKETPAATQARTQLCQAFLKAWLRFWVYKIRMIFDKKWPSLKKILISFKMEECRADKNWSHFEKIKCFKNWNYKKISRPKFVLLSNIFNEEYFSEH